MFSPFFFGKMNLEQKSLLTVAIDVSVFDCIFDGLIKSLPLHRSHGFQVGELICLEVRSPDDGVGTQPFLYAIVTDIEPWSIVPGGVSSRNFNLVRFDAIANLDSIVVS